MLGSGERLRRCLAAACCAVACVAVLIPASADTRKTAAAPLLEEIDAGLREDLADDLPTAAFVHFGAGVDYERGVDVVRESGLRVGADLPAANAVYALGRGAAFRRAAASVEVTRLEDPGPPIELTMETAKWATRVAHVQQETGGLDLRIPAPGGGAIDGSGVGIAIVDSGIGGAHPDLDWCGNGSTDDCKTVLNFKIACGFLTSDDLRCAEPIVMEDVEDSDTSSGHGTHVSGIAAGTGEVSGGLFAGVAPGASLYGFGIGEGRNVLLPYAAQSFQWIVDNHADPLGNDGNEQPGDPDDPPIMVVNNSYGGPSDYNPEDVLTKLSDALIADGVTVVWAAGNSGGQGGRDCEDALGNEAPCTDGSSANPTPGNLMVANYDDDNRGTRDGVLDVDSSRGVATAPDTWPDLSAPGSLITATCKPGTLTCTTGTDPSFPGRYGTVSGTSMASPHTAGVVALLHQASPGITPAEIEDVLEDTAYKFTAGTAYVNDPNNPDDPSSFDKGHGLVDARAAILERLGLPQDFGLSGGPSVRIARPADGTTIPARVDVAGGALSSTGSPAGSTTTLSADETGDQDMPAPSYDLERLTIAEPVPGSVALTLEVRDASSAPEERHSFDVFFSLEGRESRVSIDWDPSDDSLTCGQTVIDEQGLPVGAELPGCAVERNGNAFTLTYPLDAMLPDGKDVRGVAMFDVWAAAFLNVNIDQLPGPTGSLFIAPARGKAHIFVGDGGAAPATDVEGTVSVSVDGADPVEVATGSGAFTWAHAVGPLADGDHTIRALLQTTAGDASDEVEVTVSAGTITITSPSDDEEVAAGPVTVSGTSSTDPTLDVEGVSVRAIGSDGFDSGVVAASGDDRFASWTADLDLTDGAGQQITIVATLSLEGDRSDTDEVTVSAFCWTPAGWSDDLEPEPEDGWAFDVARNDDETSPTWAHVTDASASSPTHSFTTDAQGGDQLGLTAGGDKDDRLIAPEVAASADATLTFWHRYNLEDDYDGGFLEVSSDGGATWSDVLEAGGSFIEGGYTGSILTSASVPTAGRQAWTGDHSSEMSRVVVDLGPSPVAELLVRFRLVTDVGTFPVGAGWWVDDIAFDGLTEREPCNRRPVATDDEANVETGGSVDIDVVGNDTDPDGDDLTVTAITQPADGSATDNGDGTVTYDAPQQSGTDTFTYTISDGRGGTDEGTVTVTIDQAENRPPVAVDDEAEVADGTSITIDLIGNDTDPDGDTLELDAVDATSDEGVAIMDNGDGTVTYEAPDDRSLLDTFGYVVSDGRGGTDDGEVRVRVVRTTTNCSIQVKGTFVLDRDLVDCEGDGLVVLRDRTTIDLNGHSISGIGAPGSAGIRISGNDKVKIIGEGTISGFETGIRASQAKATKIFDVDVSDNIVDGIVIDGSRSKIEGVDSSDNGGHGIHVVGGRKHQITGNTVEDNTGYGINAVPATLKKSTIRGNAADGNNGGGMQCDPDAACDAP